MSRALKHSDELRERAVGLYFESNRLIAHVAHDLGIHRRRCDTGCARLAPTWPPARSADDGLSGRS